MIYENRESEVIIPKLKILHVDDNPKMTKLIGLNLKFAEHNFLCFNDPQQVLEELSKQNDWQLLITDGQMPGMTGQQLVETIRQKNQTIATLLLSGTLDQFNHRVFDAVRGKPFAVKDLYSGISDAYSVRQRILRR